MSKTKKVISVVLAAALIMAMATVAMVSASAAATVYFENSEGWGEVYAYVWGGTLGEEFGAWPGSLCTQVSDDVWSADIPDDCTNVIFTAGSNGPQTNNLENIGGGYIAKLGEGFEQGEFGETKTIYVWEQYGDAPVETTTAAPVVTTTAAPVVTTTAAVETTVAEPVETTVAEPVETTAVEPVETTVATYDEPVETTSVEPVETTVAEPVETTVAEPVETTSVEPVETTVAEPVADGIAVGGEEYTAKVGDVITYTATLTTPKAIENIQAVTTYDATKLTLIDATVTERFPNMTGVVANAAEGAIYFNASEISAGFDFTAGQTLITLKFEVVDASYSEIVTTIEEMVEFFGPDYVTGGEIVAEGVAMAETLVVPVEPTGTTVVEPTGTTTVEPTATTAIEDVTTDATGITGDGEKEPDVPKTGATVALYAVIATLVMAAAAVVVLRKKVNG
ncbi:MAG: starch-binding protein [Ruminococcus sp.]|nr:starch-binding protein [Ruminococcus sp.]